MTETNVVYAGYWRRSNDGLRETYRFASDRFPPDHPLRQSVSSEGTHLPWPEADVSTDQEVQEALGTLSVLENVRGIKIESYRGFSQCRLCGCRNGSREFVLVEDCIEFRWPEGLKHYIAEHRVPLPTTLRQLGIKEHRNFLDLL